MNRMQEQVRDFMRAMGQPTPNEITKLSVDRLRLRLDLIMEEAEELVVASGGGIYHSDMGTGFTLESLEDGDAEQNTVAQIDALCDLLYVTYGMAVEMGIDLAPFFELVHEANMKKGPGPVREDGKKLKPKGWRAPDIEGALKRYALFNALVSELDESDFEGV